MPSHPATKFLLTLLDLVVAAFFTFGGWLLVMGVHSGYSLWTRLAGGVLLLFAVTLLTCGYAWALNRFWKLVARTLVYAFTLLFVGFSYCYEWLAEPEKIDLPGHLTYMAFLLVSAVNLILFCLIWTRRQSGATQNE